MKIYAGLIVALAVAVPAVAQKPLRDVRAIHIAGASQALGPDRRIATCLIDKLQALGPFTFPGTPTDADAVLTLESTIPSGAMRTMWGRSPEVRATLAQPDGAVLWKGENKYKKATTVWGGSTDIECGLANGLANKIVKAISGK